jgi:uncharacterized repeat protein (TIGR02543 family)
MQAREFPSTSSALAFPSANEASNCWVTFNSNGGSAVAQQEIAPGGRITQPAASTRTGYTFSGWYSDSALTTAWDFNRIVSSDNITLYAKWTPIVYTITYHLNGGVQNPDNPDTYTIETPTITFATPTKPGGIFMGWFTDAEFISQMTQVPQGSIGNLVLYAKWVNAEYVITYHLGGGTNSPLNPATYFYDDPDIPLHGATRLGYIFSGWFDNPEFSGAPVTLIPYNSIGDRDYYARWTPITYTITWHPNGGSDPGNVAAYTIEDTIPFSPSSRAGYAFTGWFDNSQLMGGPDPGISPGMYGNRDYYAGWNIIVYQITYHLNGGQNAHTNPAQYTIVDSTIIFADPARRGYTFAGWYDSAGFTGAPVTTIPAGSIGDRALYAKWEIITYPIEYVLSGGDNSPDNPASYTVETPAIILQPPDRPGFSFVGWFDNAGFIDAPIPVIEQGTIGSLKFFARWTTGVSFPTGREHIDRFSGDPKIFIGV